MRIIFAAAVVAGLLAGQAYADDLPVCPPPGDVTAKTFDDLPEAIQTDLRRRTGEMAMPGQPFNATDVRKPELPSWRGVFVWNSGSRWLIATEHGGRGYNNPVFLYNLKETGRAQLLNTERGLPGTLCAVAQGFITMP